MKSFGKILLSVGLAAFIISNHASGNTHFVTQNGGNGAMSAAEFNALTGDHSGKTFFFSGDFSIRITVNVHGSSAGHVTLSGLQSGKCNPTASVDLSLCSGAANLGHGMTLGRGSNAAEYIIIEDFNMDGTPSTPSIANYLLHAESDLPIKSLVLRRNTLVNAPQSILRFSAGRGTNNIIEDNKFYGMGRKTGNVDTLASIRRMNNSIMRRNIFGHDRSFPHGRVIDSWSRWGGINFHECKQLLFELNTLTGSNGLLRPKEGGPQEDMVFRYNKLYYSQGNALNAYGFGTDPLYFYGNKISGINNVAVLVSSDVNNSHIWSNIIKDTYNIGIGVYSFQYVPPRNTHVSNNTVVYTGIEDYSTRSGIRMTWTDGTMRIMNNIVAYNDMSRTQPKQIWHEPYSNLQSSHNLVYAGSEKNTLWSLSSNDVTNATHTLSQMQSAGYENNSLVANPLFSNIGLPASEQGVEYKRDLRLTAGSPAINSGMDLSQYGSFSVNLSGGNTWFQNYTGYGIITFSYDDGLHPGTDWTTPIPTVIPAKFSQHGSGWERGAYVFTDKVTHLNSPNNLKILTNF